MPGAFSEDLRWRIVWHHLYKEANPEDIAEALYVSERTVRRIVALFLLTGDVARRPIVGRSISLTSQENGIQYKRVCTCESEVDGTWEKGFSHSVYVSKRH